MFWQDSDYREVGEGGNVLKQYTRLHRFLSLIIAAIVAFGSVGTLAAQSTPEASPVADGDLRVMSYNTHHSAGNDDCEDPETAEGEIPEADCSLDLPRLADVILGEDPDIVALQEVDRFWARSGGVDQPEELAGLLEMESCYGANLTHEADDHADVNHEYGVATLSRYPIISCENHFVPTTEGWEQRGMLDTRVEVPGIGEVAIINTHLQADVSGEPAEASKQRIEQAEAISEYVATLDVPVIVMGDLNSEADSGELDSLIGPDSGLVDAWVVAGSGTAETIFDGAHGEPTARIDYIIVSPHFTPVAVQVIDNDGSRMASDHFPIVADLDFADIDATPVASPVLGG